MAREIKIPVHEQYKDSVYTYSVDVTLIEETLGVTVSTATWTTQQNSVYVGASSLASKVTSAPITANSTGIATVKVAFTTSGNDAPVYFFRVHILDPEDDYTVSAWR